MKFWVTLKEPIQILWLMPKWRDNTLPWSRSTIQTVWWIPKRKFKMKKLQNASFKLMTEFHRWEFRIKLTKEFMTKFITMRMKSLWKFMARNSMTSNMNFLNKETMTKEINLWKSSKKLERNQNITNMSKKINKPIQLTSTNSTNSFNTKIIAKVKRLKSKMTSLNIWSH